MAELPSKLKRKIRNSSGSEAVSPDGKRICDVSNSDIDSSADGNGKNFTPIQLDNYYASILVEPPGTTCSRESYSCDSVTTATIEDYNARRVASQRGRNLRRQRSQLVDGETRFISCQRGGFDDARKLKTTFTKYN